MNDFGHTNTHISIIRACSGVVDSEKREHIARAKGEPINSSVSNFNVQGALFDIFIFGG